MHLISEEKNINSFKIALAGHLCKKSFSFSSKSYVHLGAALVVGEENTELSLSANSAVLFLFDVVNIVDDAIHKWMHWETQLQDKVTTYIMSVKNGKEDHLLASALESQLESALHRFPNTQTFLTAELSCADVVVYSTLFPLLLSQVSAARIKKFDPIFHYMQFMHGQEKVKGCIAAFFGSASPTLENLNLRIYRPYKAEEGSTVLQESTTMEHNKLVSEEALCKSKTAWFNHIPARIEPGSKPKPVLPIPGQKNTFITSALPYVNNVPHLGNIIGCVLSSDCFARYCRMRGDNLLFICGTDEYGTATETKAISDGLTPQQICDKYFTIHDDIYKWFNISFDHFGRTTTHYQTEIAQRIFWDLEENKKISRDTIQQLYCENCQRFLADRFIEGSCPHPGCGYEDARGDQCDKCSKLVNAIELGNPKCKLCSSTPSVKSSNHLFLNLPSIENELREWIKSSSPNWTSNARIICETWLRDGLKERCITRDLKWGTPVPLVGYTDKVFYVWFDAPIGYVSMTMEYTDQWEEWWKNPDNVSYYEFMAKDNVPFHSVVFPACQIGTGRKWTKVTHLVATEYLNYEDGKFSKSRGIGVFGDQARETGIPSDIWRFYLLYIRPEAQDTHFSWTDLQSKNNGELLNNLGNFVNRSLKFVQHFYDSNVPAASTIEADYIMMAQINEELDSYNRTLSSCKMRDALRHVLSITKIGNQYIQEYEPYKLIKPDRTQEDKIRGATVVHVAVNIVALVSILLEPYMPDTSKKIMEFTNIAHGSFIIPNVFCCLVPSGHRINNPQPLITKLEDKEIERLQMQFGGGQRDSRSVTPVAETVKSNTNSTSASTPPQVNKAEAQRIQLLVNSQGEKVRSLKSSGASKEDIASEVKLLIQLKTQLALAQGIDPAELTSSKKGKKKK